MAYIGKQPVVGNFVKLDAITTSATATYNLLNGGVAYYPQTANNCIVSLNGVIQSPTSAYTISGSTIVFSDALTASDSIDFILVLGDVLNIGAPSDATVSFAKVTSNLITGATAETSIDGADSVLIYDDSASALRKMTRTNFVAGVGETNTPYFRAYQSGTSQNLGSAGDWTKIQMNTETVDSASAYDSTTNYRFTPQKAGYYFISGAVVTYNTNYTYRWQQIAVYKNGSQYNRSTIDYNNSNCYGAGITVNALVNLNGSTDYVELYCRAYANGNTVGIDEASTSSYWSGFFLTT